MTILLTAEVSVSQTILLPAEVSVSQTILLPAKVSVSQTILLPADVSVSRTVLLPAEVSVSRTILLPADVSVSWTILLPAKVSVHQTYLPSQHAHIGPPLAVCWSVGYRLTLAPHNVGPTLTLGQCCKNCIGQNREELDCKRWRDARPINSVFILIDMVLNPVIGPTLGHCIKQMQSLII